MREQARRFVVAVVTLDAGPFGVREQTRPVRVPEVWATLVHGDCREDAATIERCRRDGMEPRAPRFEEPPIQYDGLVHLGGDAAACRGSIHERRCPLLTFCGAARVVSSPPEQMNNPESSPDTESTSERRAKPPLRVRLAVVAVSIVFALLIFEVFLRVVGYTYPVFYQPDEVRGYSLWPGAEGRYRREGAAHENFE